MHVVQGNNINTVWVDGLWRLKTSGGVEQSRNGEVVVLPEPLTSVYTRPWQRVLFHPERDANPFFHLMEALWMLAGDGEVPFLVKYNPRMEEFSDDKFVLNGAYGYRWRYHFESDQLETIIGMLRSDPTTRRAVLGMWDPMEDLGSTSKDIPCNTHCYFRVTSGRLDMTVCCRSNDAIWGAYGANIVHFSILHEFIAAACGIAQGRLTQVSNNFHIYPIHYHLLNTPTVLNNAYDAGVITVPLFKEPDDKDAFLDDCEKLVNGDRSFVTHYFQDIVYPAYYAWEAYKRHELGAALDLLNDMPCCDWQLAMKEWLTRRMK